MSRMEKWCKIVDTEEFGEVLVQKSQNDEGELTVKTTLQFDIGEIVTTISIKESDTEKESQNKLYLKMINKEACVKYANKIKEEMGL